MRNYVAVVFDDRSLAYEGLHALWELDDYGAEVTIHGAAVVHRDALGYFQVDTKEKYPALATAVGVGALLGVLAGPAGAAVGAAGGAAVGAVAGGAIGMSVDLSRDDTHHQAALETRLVVGPGQSAVIADVSEDRTSLIDTRMRDLGGIVHRRAKSDVRGDKWLGDYPYDYCLYPYEVPPEEPSAVM